MTSPQTLRLAFSPELVEARPGKSLCDGLSAVLQIGSTLWLANDESASLERLTLTSRGTTGHRRFDLGDYIDLPVPGKEDDTPEVDIEGLDYADGWLWLTGSHSRKRCKADEGASPLKAQKQLAELSTDANRCVIARIPVVVGADGLPELAPEETGQGRRRVAGMLKAGRRGNALTRALAKDCHLAPFMKLPGKENGFDVEGMAVSGNRVWLGLRGPVIAGWAVVLEVRLEEGGKQGLRLARASSGKGERVTKHFLQLGGLGIRDIVLDGDDLLLLTGPTMDLDGPVRVLRWEGATRVRGPKMIEAAALRHVLEVPSGNGCDHGEGMALLKPGEGAGHSGMLMVYDKSSQARRRGKSGLVADLFALRA